MGGFLSELGSSLAQRWISLLVLPGVLYVSVAAVAYVLGQVHAFDIPFLLSRIAEWSHTPALHSAPGQILLLTAVLIASAGAGFAAQELGSLTERLYLAADWRAWPRPLRTAAGALTERRQRRWDAGNIEYQRLRAAHLTEIRHDRRSSSAERDAAYTMMIRTALERPDRPTWGGDRINALTVGLSRDCHLDLAVIWPYLWFQLPDFERSEIVTARGALSRASALVAWGALYAVLAVWWWPALFPACGAVIAGRSRLRAATDAYAALIEAVSRLNAPSLLTVSLLDQADGGRLTDQFQHPRPITPDTAPENVRTTMPGPRTAAEPAGTAETPGPPSPDGDPNHD